MTSINFCYWLQGKFEIDGPNLRHLTGAQVEMISRHLNMVLVHEPDTEVPFIHWLRDILAFGDSSKIGWSEANVVLIRQRLNLCFIHVIDPELGDAEHQAKLDEAHNGTIKVTIPIEPTSKLDVERLKDKLNNMKPTPTRPARPVHGTNPHWGTIAKC